MEPNKSSAVRQKVTRFIDTFLLNINMKDENGYKKINKEIIINGINTPIFQNDINKLISI